MLNNNEDSYKHAAKLGVFRVGDGFELAGFLCFHWKWKLVGDWEGRHAAKNQYASTEYVIIHLERLQKYNWLYWLPRGSSIYIFVRKSGQKTNEWQ